MSSHDQHPGLRAIDGGARRRSAPTGRLMLVDEDSLASLPLAHPDLPRLGSSSCALIYTTLGALERAGLERCLRALAVRRVIDLRVSPAFGVLGLRRQQFVDRLAEDEVHYLHLRALANPHVNGSWHAENYRQSLLRHYRDHARALALLRHSLEDGPVIVLVAERSAMEFELLVKALERVEGGFEAHGLPLF